MGPPVLARFGHTVLYPGMASESGTGMLLVMRPGPPLVEDRVTVNPVQVGIGMGWPSPEFQYFPSLGSNSSVTLVPFLTMAGLPIVGYISLLIFAGVRRPMV
jgi:hypothetical protein